MPIVGRPPVESAQTSGHRGAFRNLNLLANSLAVPPEQTDREDDELDGEPVQPLIWVSGFSGIAAQNPGVRPASRF